MKGLWRNRNKKKKHKNPYSLNTKERYVPFRVTQAYNPIHGSWLKIVAYNIIPRFNYSLP